MTGKLRLITSGPFLVTPITSLATAKDLCHFEQFHEIFSSGTLNFGTLNIPAELPQKEVTVFTFEQTVKGSKSILRIGPVDMVKMLSKAGLRLCEYAPAYLTGLMSLWPRKQMPKLPTRIVALWDAWYASKIVLYEYRGLFSEEMAEDLTAGESFAHCLAVHNHSLSRMPDLEVIDGDFKVYLGYLAEKIQ